MLHVLVVRPSCFFEAPFRYRNNVSPEPSLLQAEQCSQPVLTREYSSSLINLKALFNPFSYSRQENAHLVVQPAIVLYLFSPCCAIALLSQMIDSLCKFSGSQCLRTELGTKELSRFFPGQHMILKFSRHCKHRGKRSVFFSVNYSIVGTQKSSYLKAWCVKDFL